MSRFNDPWESWGWFFYMLVTLPLTLPLLAAMAVLYGVQLACYGIAVYGLGYGVAGSFENPELFGQENRRNRLWRRLLVCVGL